MPHVSIPGNLLTWVVQTCVLVMVAAALPILFRIRHAGTRVVYGHVVLALCLLLPVIQPWKHEPAAAHSVSRYWIADIGQGTWVLWILAAGAILRMGWMFAGLWTVRTCRIDAIPLYPVPASLRAASAITHTDAVFCLSENSGGPVMLGWLAPVILLPESFLELNEEAQCGVGCHELLHVQRGDWPVTLIEECLSALMWFNPGVWLLLSQTRLAREQLVDAECVRLTGARDPYVDALLTIARTRVGDLVPAPLFLRRGHLSQRMYALLSERPMPKSRIFFSYCSIAAILALTAGFVCISFPLMGSPDAPQSARAGSAGYVDVAAHVPPSGFAEGTGGASHAAFTAPRVPAAKAQAAASIPAPVPPDPHEPVLVGVQVSATPAERAATLYLLERARQNSMNHNPAMQPFHFTVQFSAGGSVANTGPGDMTEIWKNGREWRWTASLGGTSVIRMASHGQFLENGHATAIPTRVQMLRNEIFWAVDQYAAKAQLRTGRIQWNGKPATCILASGITGIAMQTQGRMWEEEEYCIDENSGLLVLHSVAPGTFAVFGYAANQQFHGRAIPDRITIYVGGSLAVDAPFSIIDISSGDEEALTPGPEMTSDPPPAVVPFPARIAVDAASPAAVRAGTLHSMIQAEVDGAGNVVEEELSATDDQALTQPALDLVRKMTFGYSGGRRQIYVNVRFSQ